jgi:hypothetical protein
MTMNTTILNGFCLSALVLLSGCAAGTDVVAGNGEQATSTSTTSKELTHAVLQTPRTVSIAGFVHGADGAPLADTDVCLQAGPATDLDIGQCATSAADGSWKLDGIPVQQSVTIAFEKAGYASNVRAIQTQLGDIVLPAGENQMFPTADQAARFDDHTGGVEFFVAGDAGQAIQATATLITGARQDPTPVYLDASNHPVSGATAGSAGAFSNVAPGLYLLTFTGVPASCTAASGIYGYPVESFQGADTASVVVPVVEGRVTTNVGLDCRTAAGR